MNPDFGQNLGHGPEVVSSTTLPPERGSERFNWRNAILGVSLLLGTIVLPSLIQDNPSLTTLMVIASTSVIVAESLSFDRILPLRS